MKTESSIKENLVSTTTPPITDIDECIKAICEWNNISLDEFKRIVGDYAKVGTDNDWQPLYLQHDSIINPIGKYLMAVYDNKDVVFEKWNDKFFGTLKVRFDNSIRYQLWEKIIEIPFKIKAVNEDTGTEIIMFPKKDDILQGRMKNMYVVNPWWAERQRLEKEIMARLIDLAKVKGWNEIISTQNMLEDLQATLKKRWITLTLASGVLRLEFPWRKIRDTDNNDSEYIASPTMVDIDFDNRTIQSKGYSCHWFGTPNSWWNPCWWNWDNDIHHCLQNCSIKELVNMIISWAYGYNSHDTWTVHEARHPVAKLRDYVWWLYDNKYSSEWEKAIAEMKQHLEDVKHDLNIDDWLDGCSGIKDFISSLENGNETSK